MVKKIVLLKGFFMVSLLTGAEVHAGKPKLIPPEGYPKLSGCRGLSRNVREQLASQEERNRLATIKAQHLKEMHKLQVLKKAADVEAYLKKKALY